MGSKLNKILLIDDSPPTNLFHTRMLEKLDCTDEVVVKLDGLEAKTYLEKIDEDKDTIPELIFLDINMPRMDGWEFLDWFSNSSLIKDHSVVVVMVTTSPNPDDLDRADHYQVVRDFVRKPLRKEKIKELISGNFQD